MSSEGDVGKTNWQGVATAILGGALALLLAWVQYQSGQVRDLRAEMDGLRSQLADARVEIARGNEKLAGVNYSLARIESALDERQTRRSR